MYHEEQIVQQQISILTAAQLLSGDSATKQVQVFVPPTACIMIHKLDRMAHQETSA